MAGLVPSPGAWVGNRCWEGQEGGEGSSQAGGVTLGVMTHRSSSLYATNSLNN